MAVSKEKTGRRKKKQKKRNAIVWQNKDVSSKVLVESLRGELFSVFGLDLPALVDIQATNLPAIEANELRIDNLFLLEDDSYVLLDYESNYSEGNKCKYLGYIARVSKRLYNIHKNFKRIRLIIIYTADVERGNTNPVLEVGAFRLELTEVFLVDMDSDAIRESLEDKIRRGEPFDKEDIMKLVIYPLTLKGREAQKAATHKAIEISDAIKDVEKEWTVLKLLLAFTDKIISKEDRQYIREVITMSGVERMIEQEKRDAVKKAVDEAVSEAEARAEQEKADAVNEVAARAEKEKAKTAENFLKKGISVSDVAECTGLPLEKVQELAAAIA